MAITYHAGRRIQGLSTEIIETATLDHDFTESGSTSHTGNGTGNSVQGWTTNDYTYSKIDGTNDRLDFRSKGDGTNDSITYDLGSALSDSAWLIRFELTFSTLSSTGLAPNVDKNESIFGVFSSDYSSGFTANQDSLGFLLRIDRDGTDRFYVHHTDGSTLTGYTSGERNDNFTTTTYYVQMKRTSSTAFEVKFYDSTYTTEISGDFSSSVTVPSTVTGLRYFGFKNSDNYNYTGDGAGYINNVKIYDGVTSLSSKPTNVQAGSRWEETDTRKMYHYESPSVTFEDDFTSSPNGWTLGSGQTIETTGGSGTPSTIGYLYADGNDVLSSKPLAIGEPTNFLFDFDYAPVDDPPRITFVVLNSEIGGYGAASEGHKRILFSMHQNGVMVDIRYRISGSSEVEVNAIDSGIPAYDGTISYYRMIKTSDNITVKRYASDANRTSDTSSTDISLDLSSANITGYTGTADLAYLVVGGAGSTANYSRNAKLYDFKFYSGVTSLDNVWSEEGT